MASDEDGRIPSEGDEASASPDVAPPEAEPAVASERQAQRARRPFTRFAFLAFGILVALYLGKQGPQEQHVRVVLGAEAREVTGVQLQYVGHDGDIVREAHFVYSRGGAPRVVAHEPKLPDGEYRLEIDVDTLGGRRGVQRQVTLGGGSTQVDVSSVLARENEAPSRPTSSWGSEHP